MEDDQLKELLKASKKKPTAGFKERVMHQIETENALRPQKPKKTPNPIPKMWTVFGVMYGLMALVALYFYINKGQSFLTSSLVLKVMGGIAAISSVFYLISVFDDFRVQNSETK